MASSYLITRRIHENFFAWDQEKGEFLAWSMVTGKRVKPWEKQVEDDRMEDGKEALILLNAAPKELEDKDA